MKLIFLGNGGGRWVTITQRLRTCGFRIHANSNIHIDPGPGTLVSLKRYGVSAMKTDAVLVSHCHPDHYNDAEVMIEAMTKGMTRNRGFFGGSMSVLKGIQHLGPAISNYHKSKLNQLTLLQPGKTLTIADLKVKGLKTKHSDPSCVGLKFYLEDGIVTYTADTEYFEGIEKEYSNSKVIIFNVMRPKSDKIPWHLCVDDAIKITKKVKPELAILHHFGMKMIGVEKTEALRMEKTTGIKTITSQEGLRVFLKNKKIEV